MSMKVLFSALAAALCLVPVVASADSCWNHNGSVMRLQASGPQRWFSYDRPRSGLASIGVRPGTTLFQGRNNGGYYAGTARVFSSSCNPLDYYVEGPVSNGQKRVTLYGTREVYRNCKPTGQIVQDTLVFDYMHDC